MGFLYKHYEKIILAVFLLVFVLALVYLIMVFSQSKEITREEIVQRPEGEDYSRIFNEKGVEDLPEGQKGKYAFERNLKEEANWVSSEKRNPNALASSDFLKSYPAARCEKCFRVIPKAAFATKECPICKKDPGIIRKVKKIVDTDSDGDGMLDSFEKSITGMNHEDINDKWTDLDNDGYPNFTEHEAKTKLDDPKSHPPLAHRLALIGIKRTMVPIKLMRVDKRGSDEKKDWLITVKIRNKRGKETTDFKKIGAKIDLYDRRKRKIAFEILDAEIKKKEEFDKSVNMPVEKDVSQITIKATGDDKSEPITVVVGKVAYENRAKLGFKDTISDKTHLMKEGDKFTAGDKDVGTEEYQVIEINIDRKDKDKEWAKIEDVNKRQFEIGKTSKLAQEDRGGTVAPVDPLNPDGDPNFKNNPNLRNKPDFRNDPNYDPNDPNYIPVDL